MDILKLPYIYVLMFTLCYRKTTIQCVSTPDRGRRSVCNTQALDVPNGDYSILPGNMGATFTCDSGFTRLGPPSIACMSGQWTPPPPLCVAPTCRKPLPRPHLRVRAEVGDALLKFSCDVNFRLNGAYQVTCNGTTWSEDIPRCEPWKPSTACDFEAADLCGWNQNDADHEEWIWHTGSTPTKRTGPDHDHTLGPHGTGHYLYFETSGSDKFEHTAILESPLYPAAWGRRCFSFWYHILGEKDIGRLEVYVRPDGTRGLAGLVPKFTVDHNKGSDWWNQIIEVPALDKPFQIWFRAIRGTSYRSDFAIDDVSLYECQDLSPTSAMPSTTVMKTKTTTVMKTTTTTAITSKKQTTRAPNTVTKKAITTTSRTTPTMTETNPPIKTPASKQRTETVMSDLPSTISETPAFSKDSQSLHHHEASEAGDSLSVTGKVFVGVAVACVAVTLVVVGYLLHKWRSSRRRYSASLHSTNPLYEEIENQGSTVRFSQNQY
ncbi:MAM and LDL-receptor class A domain-containing protein 1-like isoform X1 [Mya arenaria]|uniref:MAM and LDL-receptor class A domain-containing protein 1-like isoform X1 n=1 Tax=Mya arenaria TaxID=6604 RepID=UPI0022E8E839|nr:MAM and LDL-receptor class A domain-containing protein 1-like isoform X1 [Mya arenaria]